MGRVTCSLEKSFDPDAERFEIREGSIDATDTGRGGVESGGVGEHGT